MAVNDAANVQHRHAVSVKGPARDISAKHGVPKSYLSFFLLGTHLSM